MFVESYGRVAVEGSDLSARVNAVLDAGTRRLRAAGFSSRSAFLTSPTFGGVSWLAHATLQSGLWVDNELRYDDLLDSDRFTLSDGLRARRLADGRRRAGERPATGRRESRSTATTSSTTRRNVGYAGPKFGYATMPDQYTLSAFQRLELAEPRPRPGDGRDRPGLEPHPVGAAAPHGRLGPGR